jgi:hypothetical protein
VGLAEVLDGPAPTVAGVDLKGQPATGAEDPQAGRNEARLGEGDAVGAGRDRGEAPGQTAEERTDGGSPDDEHEVVA